MKYLHIKGVTVSAQFSDDRKFRYRLEIEFPDRLAIESTDYSSAFETACAIMQNPSCANEEFADKSVKFLEKFISQQVLSEFSKVRRLIIVNQFAYIQTNNFRGEPHKVGPENNAAIRRALRETDHIIVAWGKANMYEERKTFVVDELRKLAGKKVFQTRVHPSRGAYNAEFIRPFSIET